jgi:hypothetical protein
LQVNTASQVADFEHKGLFAPGGIRHPNLLGPNQGGPGPVNIQMPLDYYCTAKSLTCFTHHIAFDPTPIKAPHLNLLGPNHRGPG